MLNFCYKKFIVGLAIPIVILAFVGVIILEIDDTMFKSSRHMVCNGASEKVDKFLMKQVCIEVFCEF